MKNNLLKCTATALVTGALICIHKDAIENCCRDAKKCIAKISNEAKQKNRIVLLYDMTPCNCEECHCNNDENEENVSDVSDTLTDSCCGPAESTGCGCDQGDGSDGFCSCDSDLEEYRTIFKKFSCKAKYEFIDTGKSENDGRINNYTERFGINYLPCILVLTPKDNLIAKLEAPDQPEDVEEMLRSILRI